MTEFLRRLLRPADPAATEKLRLHHASRRHGLGPRPSAILVLLVLVATSILHWRLQEKLNDPIRPPDSDSRIASFSFSPYSRDKNPEKGLYPSKDDIRRDMLAVKRISDSVRTYTVTEGLDSVPEVADELGMTVTLGIWIDENEERNAVELAKGIELAKAHPSVKRIIVGNESVLRSEKTPAEIGALMRRMRMATGKPVSTGEPWGVWAGNPAMGKDADYIAAHVLPFWEDEGAARAVSYGLERWEILRRTFPGKPILIAEFGWPSGKFVRGPASPTLANEAEVVRRFLKEARRWGIDYNLMEAFDQPWKIAEGNVGGYWGYFDADREPKFPLSGDVVPDPNWRTKAAGGIALALVLSLPLLARRRSRLPQKTALAVVAQVAGAAVAEAFSTPFVTYVNPGHVVMWALAVPFVLILLALSFDRAREIIDVLWGPRPARTPGVVGGPAAAGASRFPKSAPKPMVSIHVAACREPPEMLKETLDSLAALDYPCYEVLCVINNTEDPSIVEPVREHCRLLGPKFKFLHFPKVSGFKAGALNLALKETDPQAEVIGLVDADYVVDKDWLKDLTPGFNDPRVALIQAPQANRDAASTPLDRAMDAEYSGFFGIGMVQRNEDDAIIAHGTMLLLRRSAMQDAGNWSEWCICEDTELGLRLFERGLSALYTAKPYGWGLLPDTLKAFRSQRHRWAYGAMRIAVAHAKEFLPFSPRLSPSQKFHFLTGWLHWVGDLASVAMSALNIVWVGVMYWIAVEPPNAVLSAVTLAATLIALLHTAVLYRRRTEVPAKDVLLGALAGASLQFTVARAVFSGLTTKTLGFKRTAKGGAAKEGWRVWLLPMLPEMVFLVGLVWASIQAWRMNWDGQWEMSLFSSVLAVQSLPYAAALILQFVAARSSAMKAAPKAPEASIRPAPAT